MVGVKKKILPRVKRDEEWNIIKIRKTLNSQIIFILPPEYNYSKKKYLFLFYKKRYGLFDVSIRTTIKIHYI